MKTLFIKLSVIIMIFAFISCENESPEPEKKELDDQEVLDNITNPADSTQQDTTSIIVDYCGTSQTFELRYYSSALFGTVDVYNDEDSLHIVYTLSSELVDEGWGIHSTYLFLGNYDNLPTLDNGSVDWYSDALTMELFDGNLSTVEKVISLDELGDCFGVATKVKLNNPDPEGSTISPRAFINVDGVLEYPWMQNYEYCIQTCSSN